jgi:hypothetical protein
VKLTVPTRDGEVEVEGELLGEVSTHQGVHAHEGPAPVPGSGRRCSACRWTQIWILDDEDADEYVVVVSGMSNVPGETTRGRVVRTASPTWAVDCLRRAPGGRLTLPEPAREALAQAADLDDDIRDALHGRAQAR